MPVTIVSLELTTNPGDDWTINGSNQFESVAALAEGMYNLGVRATLSNGYVSPEKIFGVPVQPALAFPVTEYTGGRQGAIYDISKASTLWADATATTPATLNGTVRRVDDLSGRGYHLTGDSDAQSPLWKQDGNGDNYLEFSTTQFLRTSTVYTMGPLPHYIIAALSRSVTSSQPLVFAGASNTRFHRIYGNSSQRASGGLRNSPSLTETVASTAGSGEFPINTPKVIGSLALASQNDVAVNGAAPAIIANSWTTESIASARIGVGTDASGTAASGAAMNFYGAALYHGNPGSGGGSVRAQFVTWAGNLINLSL